MKDVSAAQRPVIGALANQVRSDVEAAIADKMEELKQKRLEEKSGMKRWILPFRPAIIKSVISIRWTRHSVKS